MAIGCGGVLLPPGSLVQEGGYTIPFFITGTNTSEGVIDMSAEAVDYISDKTGTDGTFLICIETAAAIVVQLADGGVFTITAVQADAYLGQWYPAKIIKVYKSGTTGTFSVGI